MRTIDIHAALVPGLCGKPPRRRRDWHGFRHEPGDGLGTVVGNGK